MAKTRKTPDYEMVTPNWILKLLESGMSSGDIGVAIGKSDQYVNQCVGKNAVAKTSEIAAEFVWQKKFGQKKVTDKIKICLVTIDAQHVDTLQKMVEAFGGNLTPCNPGK